MASYSPSTSHSNQPQSDTENWLFLGNPGTGKSTLINCLIGEAKFEAGLSFGVGKTSFFQRFEHGNIVYMDTPGLADTELRETAAKSIKEALQEDGIYKIFFVVTLQQGRGKPEDIATITEVLDSVHAPNIEFSIIVNQIGKRVHELMMKMGDEYKGVVGSLCSGKYSTGSILFLPMLDKLNEVDNALINVPDALEVFLRTKAPKIVIPKINVHDINLDSGQFKAEVKRLEQLVRQLTEDKEIRDLKWKEVEAQNQRQLVESQRLQAEMMSRMFEQQKAQQDQAQQMQMRFMKEMAEDRRQEREEQARRRANEFRRDPCCLQ